MDEKQLTQEQLEMLDGLAREAKPFDRDEPLYIGMNITIEDYQKRAVANQDFLVAVVRAWPAVMEWAKAGLKEYGHWHE